jgi:predicted esterase
MSFEPQIDGRLSSEERALAPQAFRQEFRFDNPDVEVPDIHFRLAYSPNYLYLAIETGADKICYRNRGFLWGDGWKLLLADASGPPRSARYVEIFASPKAPEDERVEMFLGVQDNQQVYRRLSKHSDFAEGVDQGRSIFEAKIAWTDIAPFQPLLNDQIGINLYFAKGLETPSDGAFAYGYSLVKDEGIWDEELQIRAFAPVAFAPAAAKQQKSTALALYSKRIQQGEPLSVTVIATGETSRPVSVSFELFDQEQRVASELVDVVINAPLSLRTLDVPVAGLAPGAYRLAVNANGTRRDFELAVLPNIDPAQARKTLSSAAKWLPEGDQHSLLFALNEYERLQSTTPGYAEPDELLKLASQLQQDLAAVTAGSNPFDERGGPYRRAFLSQQDGTLQPYSIKLPTGYDPDSRYPAIVFLHGSGTDEQGLLDLPRGGPGFIEIAPYGRDRYRAYSAPASQRDIIEALDAAMARFAIDADRVLIGGFSMGGYGALHAYYQNPERFRGVAVFAGHPNLANEWLFGWFPNFLKPHYQAAFKSVPVFIYHGEQDAALPFGLAKALADGLADAGAEVTFSPSADNGHVYQDEASQQRYLTWLAQF